MTLGTVYKRLPIAGGNWNNGANAGVFNSNLNNPRSNANWNIGFRAALIPILCQMHYVKSVLSVRRDLKDTVSTAISRKSASGDVLRGRHGMPQSSEVDECRNEQEL